MIIPKPLVCFIIPICVIVVAVSIYYLIKDCSEKYCIPHTSTSASTWFK